MVLLTRLAVLPAPAPPFPVDTNADAAMVLHVSCLIYS